MTKKKKKTFFFFLLVWIARKPTYVKFLKKRKNKFDMKKKLVNACPRRETTHTYRPTTKREKKMIVYTEWMGVCVRLLKNRTRLKKIKIGERIGAGGGDGDCV